MIYRTLTIIQRGNNRSVCFFAEEDYQLYLHYLGVFADRFDCAVHAYALMTNHVHLLLTPGDAGSAALLMKHLGQHYVQYINHAYRRSGTLWEGRFRSCLTQSEGYVLACCRYIELNPVRAGMVGDPRDYPWSSFRANAEGNVDTLITPHDEYGRLGRTVDERRAAYRALFQAHLDPGCIAEIRLATNGNTALGGKRFQNEIERALGRRARRGAPGRPKREGVREDEQSGLF